MRLAQHVFKIICARKVYSLSDVAKVRVYIFAWLTETESVTSPFHLKFPKTTAFPLMHKTFQWYCINNRKSQFSSKRPQGDNFRATCTPERVPRGKSETVFSTLTSAGCPYHAVYLRKQWAKCYLGVQKLNPSWLSALSGAMFSLPAHKYAIPKMQSRKCTTGITSDLLPDRDLHARQYRAL